MKYLNLLLALFMLACAPKKMDHFVIKGTVPGVTHETDVWLAPLGRAKAWDKIAEGKIVDGKFELQGKMDTPTCCQLILNWQDGRNSCFRSVSFFVENGELTFETPHIDSLPTPETYFGHKFYQEKNFKVTGSPAQNIFYEYHLQSISLRQVVADTGEMFLMTRNMDSYRRANESQEKLDKLTWNFLENNDNLAVNLHLANMLKKYPFTYDKTYLERLEKIFASSRDTCTRLREFRQYLKEARQFVSGSKMGDLKLSTIDGQEVSLLSRLNKNGYTVIDFWASWCGPCRAGIPHLKKISERFKNLKFISISVDDDNAAWLEAVEKEQMPWEQLKGDNSIRKQKEGFYSPLKFVPTLMVIAPDRGCIFFSESTGALEIFLESLLQ